MADIILHHYPPSPVSEKIRMAMGLKQLTWVSAEQNRLPDRPALFAMTGGYRRIPVLQVGADIYCDTQCIFRALENIAPEPSLYPDGDTGTPFSLSRWLDGPLFELGVRVAFAPVADTLPPALVADRTRLYFGPDGDMAKEAKDIPHTLSQLRGQFQWIEEMLAAKSGNYLHGNAAGMSDLLVWYISWFVRGRYEGGEAFFEQFPNLSAWNVNMKKIGHGTFSDISPEQALAIALEATPTTPEQSDDGDPQGLKPGMNASVIPLTNSGEKAVEGTIHSVSSHSIALKRTHEATGEVCVHFPRVGYRVTVN